MTGTTAPAPVDLYREYQQVRGRYAILTRHRGADDPEVLALRARMDEIRPLEALKRDKAAAQLQAHVERAVRMTPPLTDEQRDRIASILTGNR